jgi:DNA repair protein RadC
MSIAYVSTIPVGDPILVREMDIIYRGSSSPLACVVSSKDVYAFMRVRGLHQEIVEHFIVLLVDARSRPIGWSTVAKGSVSECAVKPADAFRVAIHAAADRVIFVHNHPSGDPRPSAEDISLTTRLRQAGELLGIHVLDHVIVAGSEYFSFLDSGMMGESK